MLTHLISIYYFLKRPFRNRKPPVRFYNRWRNGVNSAAFDFSQCCRYSVQLRPYCTSAAIASKQCLLWSALCLHCRAFGYWGHTVLIVSRVLFQTYCCQLRLNARYNDITGDDAYLPWTFTFPYEHAEAVKTAAQFMTVNNLGSRTKTTWFMGFAIWA